MGTTPDSSSSIPPNASRIPLWVKWAFTGFMCVLVPYYWWAYGPTNFLYFCDVSLFFTLAALWLESPLLASAPLVGIFVPQLIWQVDFLGGLAGLNVVGMTKYMFKIDLSLFVRGLSFFHFWLPIFLIWIVYRLGYDRRALPVWTVLAWILVLICYFLLPPAMPVEQRAFPDQPVNVNYVYNPLSDDAPQTWMSPFNYLAALMVFLPMVFYMPTHILFMALCGLATDKRRTRRFLYINYLYVRTSFFG
jgi:hypothetical protein